MAAISDPTSGGAVFRLSTETRDDTAIVHVEGEVDLASAPRLGTTVAQACDVPDLALVIVDLSQVTLLDSTGLSVLIERDAALRNEDRSTKLRLVVSAPQVRRVFSITGLDSVFEIYERLEDAL